MNNQSYLWVERYRPSRISEYVFHDNSHREAFNKFIDQKTIPHLLLSGVQGTGKTTIAQILISAMVSSLNVDEMDVLVINASDERGIDTFRDQIKNFASSIQWVRLKLYT